MNLDVGRVRLQEGRGCRRHPLAWWRAHAERPGPPRGGPGRGHRGRGH